MGFTVSGRNLMLEAVRALTLTMSAHTADPGESGANEVAGGTYARQSATYGAAANGVINMSNAPSIPIPAGVTVTHVGLWGDGGLVYVLPLAAAETFANGGALDVSQYQITLTA